MRLHVKILIGLALGIVWAVVSSFAGLSKFTIDWILPFGDIFINLLKLLAIPLVFFSIIKGVSSIADVTKLGRMGAKTLGFYVFTTVIAVTIGLGLVNTIQPGNRISEDKKTSLVENIEVFNEASGTTGKYTSSKANLEETKSKGPLRMLYDIVPDNLFAAMSDNKRMLAVIFFAVFFGIGLTSIPRNKAQPAIDLVDSVNEVILRLIEFVMLGAPFFVFALLAGLIAKMSGDNPKLLADIFEGLGWFAGTAALGSVILITLFYPLVIRLMAKGVKISKFYRDIRPAQTVAFSTSSSAATLPVTMECVRDNVGVSETTTNFVLPIGATINMDGTSCYQAITAVFLAQFFGFDLSFADQLMIVLMATLASIGTPAVPSAGLVMLILVLESVNMNGEWIALVFAVDRPLDMLRTVVNITGDSTAATVIATSEGEVMHPNVDSQL